MWDLRSHASLCVLQHHNAECRSVGFHPGGGQRADWLLTSAFDNTAAVVDVGCGGGDGRPRRVLGSFNHGGARVLQAKWWAGAGSARGGLAFATAAHSPRDTVRIWAMHDPGRH